MNLIMQQLVVLTRQFPGRAYLAGGACRDTALGLGVPKDYDIVVFPDVADDFIALLETHDFTVGYDSNDYDRDDIEYETEGVIAQDIMDRWSRIVKLKNDVCDIDVLVPPHEDCPTIHDVLAGFDFSINQFYVDSSEVFNPLLGISFGGRKLGVCDQLKPVDYLRGQHILGKAKVAGWSYILLEQPWALE